MLADPNTTATPRASHSRRAGQTETPPSERTSKPSGARQRIDSDELATLLGEVRRTNRATRIELRDGVAAYGGAAIDPIAQWLGEPELAAFAVRVLERIGRMDGQLKPVVRALSEGHARSVSPAITGDIDEALRHLGARLLRPANLLARRPAAR